MTTLAAGAVDGRPTAGPPPSLGPAELFALAPAGLLEIASDYVQLGYVRRPRRRGCVLAAEVEGSADVYHCRAELRPGEGRPAILPTCACPSGRPFCKHVLALLTLWSRAPGEFAAVDDLERALAARPGPEVAACLAAVAMEALDPLERLRDAARPRQWEALPPGECLEHWEAFREWASVAGRWPEAALHLGARIAGPPGSPPAGGGAPAAVASRQLAWWLWRMAEGLPPAALLPWLRHLFHRLDAAATADDAAALPPELGVYLARLATALPPERAAERRWLVRFAAATQVLAPIFEAEVLRLLWTGELGLRLASAPGSAAVQRCHLVAEQWRQETAARPG